MAELSPTPRKKQDSIPFWRDGRVIGVFGQIIFVIFVLLGMAWLLGNVSDNIGELGSFRCPDGTESFSCGFNFLGIDAQFDIAESVIAYDPSDSYARAMTVGALNTLKVSVFGIFFATILGTFTGIARLSNNWLVSNIAKWYVDFFRNTPLLLQLFFIYFGVILLFPGIREAVQPLGLPVYLSQRGINLPGLSFLPSSRILFLFLFAALVTVVIIWVLLGMREQRLGKSINRVLWCGLAFVVVMGTGWFVATAVPSSQAIMVSSSLPVSSFEDIPGVVAERLGVSDLAMVETAVADGSLEAAAVNDAALTICVVKGGAPETNLANQLIAANVPYDVDRSDRIDQALRAFEKGECELIVGRSSVLTTYQATLENSSQSSIVSIDEMPIRVSIPRIEGLNFQGGIKMTPSFAAILIGLVLYTGAFIAEIVRAGMQSVPKGQTEAARALGLSEGQRLRLIILPQAMRVIIPPLTSQYLNLAKNSSLAIAVGFADMWAISYTTLNQSGRAVQVFLIVMASYLTLSLIISFLLNWYNRRISLVER
ncbi:MAG: ABC transporter permease subunit [Anaerolineae bacterium]|nr:ABC transporter permease subunit [Anaerolineae bacterium]